VGNHWERNGVKTPIVGNGGLGEGSEEDCLLVEGVLGCGTLQSSRAGGGSGLGPVALAFCADVAGRHGCQSFDAFAPAAVKSPTGSEGWSSEADRVA
jgi:hypothetical protein